MTKQPDGGPDDAQIDTSRVYGIAAMQAYAEMMERKCAAAEARAEAAEAAARTAWNDALEEAANLAETRWHKWNEYEPPLVECDASACEEIAAAIRALMKGERA